MKAAITLLFGLTISGVVFSQNYFPIVQENKEWNVLIVWESGPFPFDTNYLTATYKISGDTVINSQIYHKVYKSHEEFPVNWDFYGGIREEDKKVWYKGGNIWPENQIYDFTVNVGDTVTIEYDSMIVDTIYDVEINGSFRKLIHFSYLNYPWFSEFWIEGIGSNRGLFGSGTAHYVGGAFWLLCMKENGELIYSNPYYENCFLTTDIPDINHSPIQIFPNPASDKVKITLTDHTSFNSIFLIDLQGNRIKEFDNHDVVFNLSGISKGLYLLWMNTESGAKVEKLIIY